MDLVAILFFLLLLYIALILTTIEKIGLFWVSQFLLGGF